MSFTINTNISSLQAQQYLNTNGAFQAKTIQRVTSGLRIVSSGDDAAGLAIANGYRSDQAVLSQGVRNANDGLSQLQIIDGGINNISNLLDRARTLATQSASGTFTGDRGVLNSEFQSVVGEINRQAQAIGLDQNGAFAQNLQVFIGGGKSNNGVSQITNGSVSVDLSKSTVDARSLGLTGVQALGSSGTDIGSGSAAGTSLSSILANATNTSSTGSAGFSTFILKGPGFDGNGVKISVNTSNLGGTSDLVTAVNAAISSAANGGTQQATALKNANITASVNTDSTGKQQLAFSSSTSAFQVQASDRVSNALLGNFEQNAVASATDSAGLVDTSAGGAAATLAGTIDGTAFSVGVGSSVNTSKGSIVSALNADSAFSSKATALLDGNHVVIKSKANASTSSISVTSGALATALGFNTTSPYTAASASTGAALNTQVQAATAVKTGANIIASDAGSTATVDATHKTIILTVGNSGPQTLTLANLGTQTKDEIAADINTQLTANGNFTSANGAQVSASVVNNKIVFTAATPGSAITIGNGNINANLGLTNASTSSVNTATTSATGNNAIKLRFQGSGLSAPVEVTLSDITAGTTTTSTVLQDLQSRVAANSQLQAAGITLSTATQGNNLVFTSSKGEQFQVQATGDSQNILGLGSFISGPGNSTLDYTSLTASSAYSTGIGSGDGPAKLEISLNGLKSSNHQITVNFSGAGTDATSGSVTGTATAVAGQIDTSGVGGTLNLVVDGVAHNITLTVGATTGANTVANDITTGLSGAGTASVDNNGHIVIKSNSTGVPSNVEVLATSDAGALTAIGLSASVHRGANATEGNVLNQINTAIAGDSTLASAGLQAKDNGSGSIQIVSNNNTFFRLNAFGAGDVGFGRSGATYTGTSQSAAPAVSQYFDSQGASATSTLAYTDTLFGSDKQTVAVTGLDTTGAKHSLGITLENDGMARQQTIDQALSQINTQLQQSNDKTLQSIVAVKDTSSGTQSIRFLSTLSNFQVSVNSDAGGTGITAPSGNVANSATLGTGLTASLDSQTNAAAAVSALSTAVGLLGKSQAVVGRGQNQFNYAVNLAQSQLTNLAAAESRIRDADLASEAANLTKSQILVQAGVAALAQANSAPQQVLSLLRG